MKILDQYNLPGAVQLLVGDRGSSQELRYTVEVRAPDKAPSEIGAFAAIDRATEQARSTYQSILAGISQGPTPVGSNPYTWTVWGSDRTEENDDCYVGNAVGDMGAALAELDRALTHRYNRTWRYAYIDGPNGEMMVKVNPSPVIEADDNDAEISEAANMAGMAFGVRGRNEVYGEDTEEAPAFGR